MRILWWSNAPWQPTGYGLISHLCDACSALSVGALVARVTERLRAQWEAERAKAGAR